MDRYLQIYKYINIYSIFFKFIRVNWPSVNGALIGDPTHLRLQLHGAIFRPDSFVIMLCYYANLKAIRYESRSLSRIVADKLHHVIVA